MDMIQLILGRAGSGKTARLFEMFAARVKRREGGLILLVPEQYSHEAERELCRAAGDSLSLYGEVLSFTGLARKVLSQCGGMRPTMDGGGRLLCMAVAAESVGTRLAVYRNAAHDARLLEGLLYAADELRAAGLGAAALAEAAETVTGPLGRKLSDLALVMEAYDAARGRSAADPADVMETLARTVAGSPAVGWRYMIDGFSDFTRLEQNVLRELIRAGASLTVCLTCDPDSPSDVFSIPMETVRFLREAAAEYGVPVVEERMEPSGGGGTLRLLRERLFDFSEAASPAGDTDDDAVRLVAARDIYEECELAASRMAELARSGARWRDMAVAVRGFADYRTALESACARYEVPLFLAGRGDILQRSIPLLIASALEAVIRGWEYDAVFGCLKTGLMPVSLEECDALENYVLLWRVRGKMWLRPFTMHPDGYNRPFDDDANGRLAALEALRVRISEPLAALADGVGRANTAREQACALADFLTAIDLPGRLTQRSYELEAAGRREAAAEYAQIWDIVCAALEQFADVLGDMTMDAERFRSLFCLMLSKYDVGVIPVSLDRVQAGDFDGMRRRHIRHLFLLGATDGRLPAPETAGGVFTSEEREELNTLGLMPGGAERELSRELWRIYACVSLPSDTLYISFPAAEADGAEARPSIVMERARAISGAEPRRGDLTRARTFSREGAWQLAAAGEAGRGDPECLAARTYFHRRGDGGALRALVQAVSAERGRLRPEGVRSLYGPAPALTPTRAEKFASCPFSYFMQYGLEAKPRRTAVFDPREYGTFMHDVLEAVARRVMDEGGFAAVTAERVAALTDEAVDDYINREMRDFEGRTARFEYLFRRLRGTVRRVTEDMREELAKSAFTPLAFELDLGAEGVLAPDGGNGGGNGGGGGARLYGRIDRVDGWRHDGALYIRVTDYKTGRKKFDLADVCDGLNMQMLLYLFTLERRGAAYFGADELRPAGVLYVPARADVVRADEELSDEEIARMRRGEVRRSGLILDEPDVIEAMEPGEDKRFIPVKYKKDGEPDAASLQSLASAAGFGTLGRFIDRTLSDMASALRSGAVDASPLYKNEQDNACVYCEYAAACMYDETKDARRRRSARETGAAWERIGKVETGKAFGGGGGTGTGDGTGTEGRNGEHA